MEKNYRVPQTLKVSNGYRVARSLNMGIGGLPVATHSVKYNDLLSKDNYFDPALTYPVLNRPDPVPFEPQFVKYDKLCLTFFGTFMETVAIYPEEKNSSRTVRIFYFLEDDTMAVMEQTGVGKIVRRKRHLKAPDSYYSWKDMNLGKEIKLNGIKFHIYGCDPYTKNFLLSKGIELENEGFPQMQAMLTSLDSVQDHRPDQQPAKSNMKNDKLKRFLGFHRQILSFDCIMEKTDAFQKENLSFKLYYYLEDDAITIKELKENQEGRHKFPLYLRRTKVPKDNQSGAFLTWTDLRVGEIINVFGTKFLLTDCDTFSRDYYLKVVKDPQPPRYQSNAPTPVAHSDRKSLPKYLGLGTPEDSLSSMFSLRPRTPKLETKGGEGELRYMCSLISSFSEDTDRRFILKYNVKCGTITIIEIPIDNSGIIAGRCVTSQRVWKPNSDPDLPQYYDASDLLVGNIILVNCNRFKIIQADKCVDEFMQKNPELFRTEHGKDPC